MEKNESLIEKKLPDMALKPRFIELTFDQMMKFSAIIESANTKGLTKEEGMITVMRGQELGISPIASLEVISMIKGKKGGSSFAYHYSLYLALIRKNLPEAEINFIQRNAEGCIIEARRSKKDAFMTFSFVKKDAQTADLLRKDNWRHYPTDLYLSKAVLRMGRVLFADVLLGLKDTPETILDWKEPLVDKISKPKKGKKGKDVIDITPESSGESVWEDMDKTKKEKKDTDKKIATEAFLKASKKSSKKGGLKLALTPKKPKKEEKAVKDQGQEFQDNVDAIAEVIEEENQKAFAEEDKKEPIVKPFNPKKKLGLKKTKKDVFPRGINLKKVTEKLVTKQLLTEPAPKKPKKEVSFTKIDDKDWEIPIIELPSFKFVEKFDLCHVKAKYKAKYDIITKGFIECIEAYFITYDIEEGTPFRDKFREIIKTKKKTMPVFSIYQKAFKDTFPPEHYHDLMKGFYDLTMSKIEELIKTGEANVGKPGNEFWGGYIDTGYRPDHNVWIHEFLTKNGLFEFGKEKVRRISE